jgi:hypothetical protein
MFNIHLDSVNIYLEPEHFLYLFHVMMVPVFGFGTSLFVECFLVWRAVFTICRAIAQVEASQISLLSIFYWIK